MKKRFFQYILAGIISMLAIMGVANGAVFAEENYGIMMSPMNQKIILTPGESYTGSFTIINMSDTDDFAYTTAVTPFYVDDNYEDLFDVSSAYTQMTEWTTVNKQKGVLSPSGEEKITFRIDVPNDAPAGGQYITITVTSDEVSDNKSGNTALIIKQAMAHIIYAEIAGTTIHKGEVLDANVPGFLLNGMISGTSSIKNTGNVHSTATYKLQVFPLFSDEELYTNEENPETKTILPDRTLINTSYWEDTPNIGIFNVVYTAEFEGVTTEVKKTVVVCPIWLLAIIIFVVLLIIFWIVAKVRAKNKLKKHI